MVHFQKLLLTCSPWLHLIYSRTTISFPIAIERIHACIIKIWGKVRGCRKGEKSARYWDLLDGQLVAVFKEELVLLKIELKKPKLCFKALWSGVRKLLFIRDEQRELYTPWNLKWDSHRVQGLEGLWLPTKVRQHLSSLGVETNKPPGPPILGSHSKSTLGQSKHVGNKWKTFYNFWDFKVQQELQAVLSNILC